MVYSCWFGGIGRLILTDVGKFGVGVFHVIEVFDHMTGRPQAVGLESYNPVCLLFLIFRQERVPLRPEAEPLAKIGSHFGPRQRHIEAGEHQQCDGVHSDNAD